MGANVSSSVHKKREMKRTLQATRFSIDELERHGRSFFALCPDGGMEFKLFIDLFLPFHPHDLSESSYERHLFRSFDLNADGRLDFGEYARAVSIIQRGSEADRLDWMFRLYDTNRCGVITEESITAVIRAVQTLPNDDESANNNLPRPFWGVHCQSAEAAAAELFALIDERRTAAVNRAEFFRVLCKNKALRTKILNCCY